MALPRGVQLHGYHERWFAAAGSLGFDGLDSGHPPVIRWYKKVFRSLGLLDPTQFTVVTKTLTVEPRQGRLTNWSPWRAARPVYPLSTRSMVNAVALTNPGLDRWIISDYPRARLAGLRLVVSVQPDTTAEASLMGHELGKLTLAGIELNSCPNVPDLGDPTQTQSWIDRTRERVIALRESSRLPVILKLAIHQPWLETCRQLDGEVAAFVLLNACPWYYVHQRPARSPLLRYGVEGSVSGGMIADHCLTALRDVNNLGLKTPLIASGGIVAHTRPDGRKIDLTTTSLLRFQHGASAISFGTAFLWQPWGPNQTKNQIEQLNWTAPTHENHHSAVV